MAMTDAALTAGSDPDRASFTIALETAREQLTAAAGITGTGDPSDTGRIGAAVLARLLPARRARYSARKVRCGTSRYATADPARPALPVTITEVRITITAPPPGRAAARPRRKADPTREPRRTARQKVTAIMTSSPGRDWSGSDLAPLTGISTPVIRTQLAVWARSGYLIRTSPGRFTLPAPPAATTDAGP
jgi:hypothetical protein